MMRGLLMVVMALSLGCRSGDRNPNRLVIWESRGRLDATWREDQHPHVRWALETHAALMACIPAIE